MTDGRQAAAKHFSPPGTSAEIEHGSVFMPKFDKDGLIPAIVSDANDRTVLMFAWMNAEAVQLTLATRKAHFWSRSRGKIWLKGEESGNLLDVASVRIDCDQDVLLVEVRVAGAGVACHTGTRSCFYRSVALGTATAEPTGLNALAHDALAKRDPDHT